MITMRIQQKMSFFRNGARSTIVGQSFQFTFINNQQNHMKYGAEDVVCWLLLLNFCKNSIFPLFLIVCFHFHSFIYTFISNCFFFVHSFCYVHCSFVSTIEDHKKTVLAVHNHLFLLYHGAYSFSHINGTFQIIFKDDNKHKHNLKLNKLHNSNK